MILSGNIARKIALLQVYIHIRKGVEVDILPPRNIKEFELMNRMHKVANDWMKAQNYQTFPI